MNYLTKVLFGIGAIGLLLCAVLIVALHEAPKFVVNMISNRVGSSSEHSLIYPQSWGSIVNSVPYYGYYGGIPFVGLRHIRFESGREVLAQDGVSVVYWMDQYEKDTCGTLLDKYYKDTGPSAPDWLDLQKECLVFSDGIFDTNTQKEIVLQRVHGIAYVGDKYPLDNSELKYIDSLDEYESIRRFSIGGAYMAYDQGGYEGCGVQIIQTSTGKPVLGYEPYGDGESPVLVSCSPRVKTFGSNNNLLIHSSYWGMNSPQDVFMVVHNGRVHDILKMLDIPDKPQPMVNGLDNSFDLGKDIDVYDLRDNFISFSLFKDMKKYPKGNYTYFFDTSILKKM